MRVAYLVVIVFGCGNRASEPATGNGTGDDPGSSRPAAPSPESPKAGSATTAPAPASKPAEPDLPLSSDVLPPDEATPNTRVASGDGFLFQVPKDFTRVDRPDHAVAYSGTLKGFAGPAQVTLWAQVEPFGGALEALVKRESDAAKAAGATAVPDSIVIVVGKDVKQGYARRLTIKGGDRIELRTVAVHDGKAYVFHCETPNVANAWANIGSDCITRSTTFHIAPPPLSPQPPPAAAPPHTPGVVYMGAKTDGKARTKDSLKPFLVDKLVPALKPCVVREQPYTVVTTSFEIAADGSCGKSSAEGKASNGAPRPISAETTACIAKAMEQAKADSVATGVVKASVVLMTNPNAE